MNFHNRRQHLIAVFMSVWLCGWIGATLFHGITHAAQSDAHSTAPCLTCSFLHQPAPAKLDFSFAPLVARFFEVVREIRIEISSPLAQVFSFAISPRGPPSLLLFDVF